MNNIEWKNYRIADIFDIIKVKGKSIENYNSGDTPYISTSNVNNGLSGFIESDNRIKSPSNVLSVDPINGTVFYHPYEFVGRGFAGSAINLLHSKFLNEYTGLFLAKAIEHSSLSKASYGVQLNGNRLAETMIWIPINSDNEPNWEYMESCIKKYKYDKKNLLLNFLNNQIKYIGHFEEVILSDAKWGEFKIEEIAKVRGGQDWHAKDRVKGLYPFIGASSVMNGITDFIDKEAKSQFVSKNAISINRNGSIGYSFFHPYDAYFSGDTRFLELLNSKFKNEYVSLFLTTVIKLQKDKYMYGYKMGTERIKNQKIYLPIKTDGKIDYEFMENYIKGIKLKKIKNTLEF